MFHDRPNSPIIILHPGNIHSWQVPSKRLLMLIRIELSKEVHGRHLHFHLPAPLLASLPISLSSTFLPLKIVRTLLLSLYSTPLLFSQESFISLAIAASSAFINRSAVFLLSFSRFSLSLAFWR
jgi:hypothetical protein